MPVPAPLSQIHSDEGDVDGDGQDVRQQLQAEGVLLMVQQRGDQPDPKHDGRADHIQRPGPLGAQKEVQNPAADAHRGQHRGQQDGQLEFGGGGHLFPLGAVLVHRLVGVLYWRMAEGTEGSGLVQLYAAVDAV